jgi:hypothetical protein
MLSCAVPTSAQGVREFFDGVDRDIQRRQCWPHPFVEPARQAAREPFVTGVANAWERQNMLSDMHFEAGGDQLNEIGRQKILWIMNDAPEQHRMVFVHRGVTPMDTSKRIQIVQSYIVQNSYDGQYPTVCESKRPDEVSPADRVDWVGRKAITAAPDPKLMPKTDSITGGSGK